MGGRNVGAGVWAGAGAGAGTAAEAIWLVALAALAAFWAAAAAARAVAAARVAAEVACDPCSCGASLEIWAGRAPSPTLAENCSACGPGGGKPPPPPEELRGRLALRRPQALHSVMPQRHLGVSVVPHASHWRKVPSGNSDTVGLGRFCARFSLPALSMLLAASSAAAVSAWAWGGGTGGDGKGKRGEALGGKIAASRRAATRAMGAERHAGNTRAQRPAGGGTRFPPPPPPPR